MKATIRISDDVAQVLDQCRIEGNALILSGQLDRGLYTATNKIIEALGGKWNRTKKAHIFTSEPADVVSDAIATRSVVDAKKLLQFYETPVDVADRIVRLLDLEFATRLLEPSAGHGALIDAVIRGNTGTGVPSITAIEIDPAKCARLDQKYPAADVICGDFLERRPLMKGRFPLIGMNPPFTRQQDLLHVRHAFEHWLEPGGRLVSVLSNAWPDRSDRRSSEFREFVDLHQGQWESLPDGAFASSGTMVRTGLLRLQKGAGCR